MKKYFAKYLPVEGEIKEGDVTKGSSGAFYDITKIHVATNKKGLTNYKLFKLFLCSTDIQVDDKIKAHHLQGKGDITDETVDEIDGCIIWLVNGPDVCAKHVYKIIGEISPDAVWIKEGDEFDEDEISIEYQDKVHPINNFSNKTIKENVTDNKIWNIKVKCSQCKTYH